MRPGKVAGLSGLPAFLSKVSMVAARHVMACRARPSGAMNRPSHDPSRKVTARPIAISGFLIVAEAVQASPGSRFALDGYHRRSGLGMRSDSDDDPADLEPGAAADASARSKPSRIDGAD